MTVRGSVTVHRVVEVDCSRMYLPILLGEMLVWLKKIAKLVFAQFYICDWAAGLSDKVQIIVISESNVSLVWELPREALEIEVTGQGTPGRACT